ncbi:MAG: hypothetical protein P8104_09825 [Gammaproteobacteria bacterium]
MSMNVSLDMLGPVVSLVAWSLVMCAWMFVTRLTAVRSMKSEGGGMNLIFAWLYVVLRVMHSLIQSLVNKIEARFVFFLLSNVPLFALAFNAVKSVFGWAGGVE